MTLTIPWWAIPTVITLVVLAVANWWPDDSIGVSAAAGGFIRLFFTLAGLSAMWIGVLIWRLAIS